MYSLLFEIIHNTVWRCVMCSSNTTVGYCVGDPDNCNIYWRCSTCIVGIDIDYTKINIYIEVVTAYNNSHYTYYDRDTVMRQYQPNHPVSEDPDVFRSALSAFTLTKI